MPDALRGARVAIVHDFLNQPGGAENVVEVFADMFPGAPVYTSVYDADRMPDSWRKLDIRTSFLQRFSPRLSIAKAVVPLYPTAFESFNLSGYDVVLSSTTSFAKGVITRPETCHICYCNNPTRFVWMYHDYVAYERLPAAARYILPWIMTPLRTWDYVAAQRVDYFVAGSHNAARRIAKYYRRESDVLQAPVDVSRFTPTTEIGDYFLVVSRLQPYKRIDIAIEACNRLGLPLHIAGDGPDRERLESLAGPTVSFLGRVSTDERAALMASCRAFLLPGEEDYGLTPLEAMASGRPVIAYRRGGALETVQEGVTGTFFDRPCADSLACKLASFDDGYDPAALRAHAENFDKVHFKQRLYEIIARHYVEHRESFVT
ncbi:MAG TPA: glycosyltransferase [Chloroflexota bacterium]|nr:glycosyltransferase [Chloroflexota bacterium]